MADLRESPEPKRSKTSSESSVISLDTLLPDCLPSIFQYLALIDLLRLRYQCRSLNDAVLQYLRISVRKLQVILDADRTQDEWDKAAENFTIAFLKKPESRPISSSDAILFDPKLLANQSHFRLENFVPVSSSLDSVDSKIDSLTHFITTYTPNLTKFALLISHEHHFRFMTRLLGLLPKLKVLLIDLTHCVQKWFHSDVDYPAAEVADAVAALPDLESLYYFRSSAAIYAFDENSDKHSLSTGENLIEVMLPRLLVLHTDYLEFPEGMTFDKIQEIGTSTQLSDGITKNYFPAVRTLFSDFPFYSFSQLDGRRLSFKNLKVLKLEDEFNIDSDAIISLNDLPNLEELHCNFVSMGTIRVRNVEVLERNITIVRLYSKIHPYMYGPNPDDPDDIDDEQCQDYAIDCKNYFRGLREFRIERPAFVAVIVLVDDKPEVDENPQ